MINIERTTMQTVQSSTSEGLSFSRLLVFRIILVKYGEEVGYRCGAAVVRTVYDLPVVFLLGPSFVDLRSNPGTLI